MPNAREIEIAVLGNDNPEVSVPGEIVPSREFYDFEAKYLDNDSRLDHSGGASSEGRRSEVKRLAIDVFRAVDCAGMARVDFLMDGATGSSTSTRSTPFPASRRSACIRRCGRPQACRTRSCSIACIALARERHADKQQLRTSVT